MKIFFTVVLLGLLVVSCGAPDDSVLDNSFWVDANAAGKAPFFIGTFKNICHEEVDPDGPVRSIWSVVGPRAVGVYEATGFLCRDRSCEETTITIAGTDEIDSPMLQTVLTLREKAIRTGTIDSPTSTERLLLPLYHYWDRVSATSREPQGLKKAVMDEVRIHCDGQVLGLDFVSTGIGTPVKISEDGGVCFLNSGSLNDVGKCYTEQQVLSTRPEWAAASQFPSE